METVNIDALPYVDKEYDDPGMKKIVDDLISDEMKNNISKDKFTIPKSETIFKKNPLMRSEYERKRRGENMAPFDTSRYRLQPPSGSAENDPKEWEKSMKNAKSQLEHQDIRIENLELLSMYGQRSWVMHNDFLEKYSDILSKELETSKEEVLHVNKSRKYEQTEAMIKLSNLESLWAERVYKIAQLKVAIASLEGYLESHESN
ncbi:hypothetical protein BB559_003018 [Furculomyces boomerangus]|uniref:Pre-mRNA-splicing factor SPF27 n=1 Tax=Furculomyces boomerangus TaxID=61424 RepID=A0A2T9YPW6_9FUNG|nr:hypothetical protein BB559_003018 [Furculomyces boomerangus]